MTPPEVDQELERLLIATRTATLPTSDARVRVRAAVAARLASPNAGSSVLARRAWLPWMVVGLVGLGAASLLAGGGRGAPRALSPAVASTLAVPVVPSAAPGPGPAASLALAPVSAAPAPAAPGEPLQRGAAKLTAHVPVAPSGSAVHTSSHVDADDELPLVRDMQAALRAGDAARTLELASKHVRRFPRGALVQEREGLSAVARCQLAPAADRAPILAAFLATFGGSPYAARVKAACQ